VVPYVQEIKVRSLGKGYESLDFTEPYYLVKKVIDNCFPKIEKIIPSGSTVS